MSHQPLEEENVRCVDGVRMVRRKKRVKRLLFLLLIGGGVLMGPLDCAFYGFFSSGIEQFQTHHRHVVIFERAVALKITLLGHSTICIVHIQNTSVNPERQRIDSEDRKH